MVQSKRQVLIKKCASLICFSLVFFSYVSFSLWPRLMFFKLNSLRRRPAFPKAYPKRTKLGGSAKNKEQREGVRRAKETPAIFFIFLKIKILSEIFFARLPSFKIFRS